MIFDLGKHAFRSFCRVGFSSKINITGMVSNSELAPGIVDSRPVSFHLLMIIRRQVTYNKTDANCVRMEISLSPIN